jgi:hypothetical protein
VVLKEGLDVARVGHPQWWLWEEGEEDMVERGKRFEQ